MCQTAAAEMEIYGLIRGLIAWQITRQQFKMQKSAIPSF